MDNETNLMDDLASAWDDAEGTESEDVPRETMEASNEQPDEPTQSETTAELQDASAETDTERDEDTEPVPAREGEDAEDKSEQSGGDSSGLEKPPESWAATAREKWKDIPKEAREYIQTREQQMMDGMQKNAQMAQRAGQMDQALAPFSQFLNMNGSPGETIKGLLQTGSGLQLGSPIQKAQVAAKIIKDFGVDIQILDGMLVGQAPPPEVVQQQSVQQQVQAALQQRDQQQQQMAYQQQQQVAGQSVQQFSSDPKNEFYKDVSSDMADILDMAGNRGQQLSMEDAYERACRLHPEVSKIISSRQQTASLSDKRRAATSIAGSPGGPGGTVVPDSMHDMLSTAWDNVGRT